MVAVDWQRGFLTMVACVVGHRRSLPGVAVAAATRKAPERPAQVLLHDRATRQSPMGKLRRYLA